MIGAYLGMEISWVAVVWGSSDACLSLFPRLRVLRSGQRRVQKIYLLIRLGGDNLILYRRLLYSPSKKILSGSEQ